jgi:hypothetical protein
MACHKLSQNYFKMTENGTLPLETPTVPSAKADELAVYGGQKHANL